MDDLKRGSPLETLIETALAEPAIASLDAAGAPVFVAAGSPLAIVRANAAARAFFADGGDLAELDRKLLESSDQGSRRLAELASLLRPEAPARLERLRFTIARRIETLTCMCRRLGDEETILVVGALGVRVATPLPPAAPALSVVPDRPAPRPADAADSPAERRPAIVELAPPSPGQSLSVAQAQADLARRFDGAHAVRFLWKTDAEGRLPISTATTSLRSCSTTPRQAIMSAGR